MFLGVSFADLMLIWLFWYLVLSGDNTLRGGDIIGNLNMQGCRRVSYPYDTIDVNSLIGCCDIL